MYKTADILEAACTIRPYLSNLLEAKSAEATDQQIADLLSQANSGQPVENLILELLSKEDSTREWMRKFLQNRLQAEHLRTFSPLPGNPSEVPVSKFICAQGDYIWYRPRVGVEPPLCPTHNLSLHMDEANEKCSEVVQVVQYAGELQKEPTRLYTVWFGTNRKPVNVDDHSSGFTGEREIDPRTIHYGSCEVAIPNSHKFGSVGSPWWKRWIKLEDDRLKLMAIDPSSKSDFWRLVKEELVLWDEHEKQALVYLHGYNVTFEEAAIRAAQIGFDLKKQGVMAFFSWPSRGMVQEYPADAAVIEASEVAITEFLVRFARDVGARRVDIIAHSMGNRGLLRAMQRIQNDVQRQSRVKFGQIFLAAPDVDADLFRQLSTAYTDLSSRTTLYVSPADKAVGLSQWLYDSPRAGFTPPITVVPGIDTVEVPDFDIDILGHRYYSEAEGILHDMFDLLRRNAPPNDRQRLHAVRPLDGLYYWKIR